MAQREQIVDMLYPLFVRDIKRVIQTGVTPNAAAATAAAATATSASAPPPPPPPVAAATAISKSSSGNGNSISATSGGSNVSGASGAGSTTSPVNTKAATAAGTPQGSIIKLTTNSSILNSMVSIMLLVRTKIHLHHNQVLQPMINIYNNNSNNNNKCMGIN